ncbi:MAG: uridine kinase [Legionellales bacterium]|nr:uridine kinase [Legionellales bacterium]
MKTINIVISGGSGSGKSTLAENIAKEITEKYGSKQIVVISGDSYYKDQTDKTPEERVKNNYDRLDAFDLKLQYQQMTDLKNGNAIQVPIYDFVEHNRSPETTTIEPHQIVIWEGIMLLADDNLRDLFDLKLFVNTDLDICLIRRTLRDIKKRGRTVEDVFEQWEKTVRPGFIKYIEPSQKYADIIVPNGGENRLAIDMIKSKIKWHLEQNQAAESQIILGSPPKVSPSYYKDTNNGFTHFQSKDDATLNNNNNQETADVPLLNHP